MAWRRRKSFVKTFEPSRRAAAADGPKTGFWPEGVGHKDIFDRGGFEAARDFIESSVTPALTPARRRSPRASLRRGAHNAFNS